MLQHSASDQLRALSGGGVSAGELIAATIERRRRRDEELGAFSAVDDDAARAEAAAVDAGDRGGRLAGVPVSVKHSVATARLSTAHGRRSDEVTADRDSPPVAILRAQGAVLVGKTNVPVYLNGHQSSNADFGVTRNPWDTARSPGGSSGGAAAAVAAGMSAFDYGSDLAGSLRVPAAWCGLFGHKPSTGIVPKIGNLPWPVDGAIEPPASAIGPMTRSAEDLELLVPLMVGVAGPDAVAWRIELPPPRAERLDGLRVGLWLDDSACLADAETRQSITRFAAALDHAGASVQEIVAPPGGGEEGQALFRRLQAAEVSHGFDDERFAAVAGSSGAWGEMVSATFRDVADALERRALLVERWRTEVFGAVDIVLCPAAPTAAPPLVDAHDGGPTIPFDGAAVDSDQVPAWSRVTSLPKLPTTVVPLGRGAVSGLPIGAQLVGPYLEDRTPVRVARIAEAEGIVGYTPPPGWE